MTKKLIWSLPQISKTNGKDDLPRKHYYQQQTVVNRQTVDEQLLRSKVFFAAFFLTIWFCTFFGKRIVATNC